MMTTSLGFSAVIRIIIMVVTLGVLGSGAMAGPEILGTGTAVLKAAGQDGLSGVYMMDKDHFDKIYSSINEKDPDTEKYQGAFEDYMTKRTFLQSRDQAISFTPDGKFTHEWSEPFRATGKMTGVWKRDETKDAEAYVLYFDRKDTDKGETIFARVVRDGENILMLSRDEGVIEQAQRLRMNMTEVAVRYRPAKDNEVTRRMNVTGFAGQYSLDRSNCKIRSDHLSLIPQIEFGQQIDIARFYDSIRNDEMRRGHPIKPGDIAGILAEFMIPFGLEDELEVTMEVGESPKAFKLKISHPLVAENPVASSGSYVIDGRFIRFQPEKPFEATGFDTVVMGGYLEGDNLYIYIHPSKVVSHFDPEFRSTMITLSHRLNYYNDRHQRDRRVFRDPKYVNLLNMTMKFTRK